MSECDRDCDMFRIRIMIYCPLLARKFLALAFFTSSSSIAFLAPPPSPPPPPPLWLLSAMTERDEPVERSFTPPEMAARSSFRESHPAPPPGS